MSKLLSEISYSVLEQVSNFNITDDTPYPIKWFDDTVVAVNASLMRQYYDAHKLNDELLLMHRNIPIEPIEDTLVIDGIRIQGKYGYCKADIPFLLTGVDNKVLSYVGPDDLSLEYSRRKITDLINDKGVVWKISNPVYAISGTRLFFKKSPQLANVVTVIGYFRDPREVNTFNEETDPFPTPSEYKLEMLALQQVMQSMGLPLDLLSDAQREYLLSSSGSIGQKKTRRRSRDNDDYDD